jgi:hypothetical protein
MRNSEVSARDDDGGTAHNDERRGVSIL